LPNFSRRGGPPFCPNSFYENLKISIEKRLFDNEEADLPKWVRVLELKQWPEEIQNHLIFSETETRHLCTRLCLNEREMI
jgi:hypothetical protein